MGRSGSGFSFLARRTNEWRLKVDCGLGAKLNPLPVRRGILEPIPSEVRVTDLRVRAEDPDIDDWYDREIQSEPRIPNEARHVPQEAARMSEDRWAESLEEVDAAPSHHQKCIRRPW